MRLLLEGVCPAALALGRRNERRHGNVKRVGKAGGAISQLNFTLQLLAKGSDQPCPEASTDRGIDHRSATFGPRKDQSVFLFVDVPGNLNQPGWDRQRPEFRRVGA